MIDLQVENVQPINIKNMELNRYRVDDNIRKSIILYNKAVAEIRAKDFDLAIADLKKALSYNRGFPEAIKLLGLCYVTNKELKRAEKTFKKLGKYDIYRELSKEYIKNVEIEKNTYKTLEAIRKVNGNANNNVKNRNKAILGKYLKGKSIIGFSILLSGIILAYLFSAKFQTFLNKAETSDTFIESEKRVEDNPDSNMIAAISYEEFENIQKKLDDTKFELDDYKNKYDILLMLSEAEKAYSEKNYEKSASTLLNMKNMKFDDETKIRFDKLWTSIKTNGMWTIYDKGNRLYKERKYLDALPKLKIVSEIDPNLDIMPWITYQIGVCYKETNDNTNALVFFQRVKENYPKSNYVSSSERMINEIVNKK